MIQSLKNIWNIPELRKRVLYTLGLLAIYRIGGHIPTPGIDNAALLRLFEQQAGSVLGYVDLFAGGNFKRFTIFALGRSEERRVGKGCRVGWWRVDVKE